MTPQADIRELFLKYYRPLCLYALHYLKDADAAVEVVQEAFTAWWQKDADTQVGNVRSYLYTMVRNRCIDLLRRQGREAERLQPEDATGVITDEMWAMPLKRYLLRRT